MIQGLDLIISLLAVFVGATVMGTVSFGLALVVAPVLLIFLEPHSVVIIANLLIVILLTMVFVKVRQHLQMSKLYGFLKITKHRKHYGFEERFRDQTPLGNQDFPLSMSARASSKVLLFL